MKQSVGVNVMKLILFNNTFYTRVLSATFFLQEDIKLRLRLEQIVYNFCLSLVKVRNQVLICKFNLGQGIPLELQFWLLHFDFTQ